MQDRQRNLQGMIANLRRNAMRSYNRWASGYSRNPEADLKFYAKTITKADNLSALHKELYGESY